MKPTGILSLDIDGTLPNPLNSHALEIVKYARMRGILPIIVTSRPIPLCTQCNQFPLPKLPIFTNPFLVFGAQFKRMILNMFVKSGIQKDRIVHIDDSKRNCRVLEKAGFRTIRVSPKYINASIVDQYKKIIEEQQPARNFTYSFDSVSRKNRELTNQYIQDKRGWAGHNYSFEETETNPAIKIFFKRSSYINEKFKGSPHVKNMSVTSYGQNPIEIYFNLDNWENPPKNFTGDRETYRRYLIQHEFGHAIGFGHAERPEINSGKRCPVMLQQTKHTMPYCTPNFTVLPEDLSSS